MFFFFLFLTYVIEIQMPLSAYRVVTFDLKNFAIPSALEFLSPDIFSLRNDLNYCKNVNASIVEKNNRYNQINK